MKQAGLNKGRIAKAAMEAAIRKKKAGASTRLDLVATP